MAKILQGVTLPDDLIWENQFHWSPIRMFRRYTLGGTQMVYTQSVSGGRPFDLVATEETGWLTYSMVTQLFDLSMYDTVMTLDWEGTTYNVMWRFDDPPVIDVTPLDASTVTYTSNTLFIGRLKLIGV